ncbi:MAG: hypothetical protein OJJ54_23855 [Pseudonocardia sp.]|nr:hypothetical protein [Pseudonocardia sp.]
MPLFVSIPMGPLRYTKRIGGTKSNSSKVVFWVLFGWWLYLLAYMAVGTWVCTKHLCRWTAHRAVALWIWWRSR